ncbi:Ig-like domain-containing protein [Vallitalea pronyensis]|uniref:Ig-like domain-containing protein n=1 Tax=Vallitalea pronyensis TaxID=1348613 RepID=A0A8J8MHB4_9FIRM|nr:MG2 domain-containing protein [Vallitalea pronyensis]QUI21615.1 Ig-like domain-containing protein [Vallitalea pronyensis]
MKLLERLTKMTKQQKIIGGAIGSILLVTIIVISIMVGSGNQNQPVDAEIGITHDGENRPEDTIKDDHHVYKDMVMEVESMVNTEYGMVTKPTFKITSNVPMKESAIKKQLRLSPSKDYSLEKVNDKAYIVSVKEAYNHNEIVKLTYENGEETKGWAFQTEKAFMVASTHPADQGEYVPIDSGIECFFTKDLDGKKIDDYFIIQPAVTGNFQYHENKVIFVPDIHLEKDIDYTITIKKGYSNGVETLEQDYVFSFHTNRYASKSPTINLRGSVGNMTFFHPDTPQVLACYFGDAKGEVVDITVYKFGDEQAFIKGYEQHDTMSMQEYVNTMKTEKHSYQIEVKHHDHNHYLELQQMEKGYYFLTVKYENSMDRMFIQVSPFNGYTAVDKDKFLVWMVDSTHSSPVMDAKVIVNGEHLGKTNKDGLAIIHKSLNQEATSWITLQANNEPPLYLPTDVSKHEPNYRSLYWSYLYFDRGLYLPTDDIQIFGFAQRRDGKAIEQVKIQIENNDGRLIEEKEVTLSDIGTYQTEFHLDNYLKSYVYVIVLMDNQEIKRQYLRIADFKKPVIRLSTHLDKDYIMMGDTVKYTADATFYEGTPAAHADIQLRGRGFFKTNESHETCDAKGHKELILTPSLTTSDWRPSYARISTQYAGLEQVYVEDYTGLIVFPRDIMVEGEVKKKSDESMAIHVAIHQINLDGFQGKTYQYEDYRGDKISGQPVSIDIVETYYEKIYQGKGYDYISKVSYDVYDYKWHENTVKTITGTTDDDGHLTVSYDKVLPERGYKILLNTQDSKGRNIQEKMYYSKASNHYQDYHMRGYTCHLDQIRYKKNQPMQMDIRQGFVPITEEREHDQVLYFICQDGIMDYGITDKTTTTIPYHSKYVPNAELHAIYFDGNSLHQAGHTIIQYDYEDEALAIQIETDKQNYKPGDQANVTVKVTDKDQKPVQGDVNVNIVDEAFLALYEDTSDVLYNLYSSVYRSGLLGEYLGAYNNTYGDGGPERGGEGEADFIRSDFKNTADFITITTNAKGIGEASFTIPDNLTSWRITCTAMDKQLRAGKEKYNITTTLPFFVSSIINNHYLKGDVIEATVKTAGAHVTQENEVTFTAIVKNEKGESNKVVTTGKGYQYVNLPIGELPVGQYTITIIGESGAYKDGESYEVDVVESFHYFDMTLEEDLTKDMQIVSNGQDVQLRFFNEDVYKHYSGLMSIYNRGSNHRNDMKVIAHAAGETLNKLYSCDLTLAKEPDDIMRHSGLYGGFDYGEASAVTTAELVSIGYVENKERQIKGLMKAAMNEKATTEENAAALWGLTLLGEPILFDVIEMYELYQDKPITLESLYLMHALLDIGEMEKGRNIYDKAKKQLKKQGDVLYMDGEKYKVKFTAMMMIGALKLDHMEDAEAMYLYLKGTQDVFYPTLAERLYYLQHTIPKSTTVAFTYVIAGEEETITMDYHDYYELNLTPEDASLIKFFDIQGKIKVEKSFTGQVKDIDKTDRYSITRWYTKETSGEEIQQGEIMTVHIKVEVHDPYLKYFNIEDMLPAGFTYLGHSTIKPYGYVWIEDEVHRTHIHVYSHSGDTEDTGLSSFEITYKAKAILAGEYTAEPVVIRDNDYNEASYSEPNRVKVY